MKGGWGGTKKTKQKKIKEKKRGKKEWEGLNKYEL